MEFAPFGFITNLALPLPQSGIPLVEHDDFVYPLPLGNENVSCPVVSSFVTVAPLDDTTSGVLALLSTVADQSPLLATGTEKSVDPDATCPSISDEVASRNTDAL